MSAQGVVSKALREVLDHSQRDPFFSMGEAARFILDALSANNFEVVELVEPYADENTDYYPAPSGWMIETPDCLPGVIAHDVHDEPLTPNQGRDLARAFLSAARDIERKAR